MTIPTPLKRVKEYENLAFGLFLHWGLYSQLQRGEWIQRIGDIPSEEYIKLKDKFTAEDFDAAAIADIAKNSGIKYITLTTRHHDGFSLYDTKGLSDFDSVQSPAGRDLVAEFVEGCRKAGIVPFLYHTTLDWYHQDYINDFDSYLDYLHKSVEILCTNYGKIGGLWFDGNWNKPTANWKEDRLYGIIRKHQPEAIIINNTGMRKRGETGHHELDVLTFEQGRPNPLNREGMEKYLAAEMCQTVNRHWGIAKNDFNYLSTKQIIENFCSCRKVGANYLLNIGPTASGKIPDYEKAILEKIGQWVKIYEESVYETKPSQMQTTYPDFILEDENSIYLFIHNLAIAGHGDVTQQQGGAGPRAFKGISKKIKSVIWMDNQEELEFTQDTSSGLLCVNFTGYPYGSNYVVRVAKVVLK